MDPAQGSNEFIADLSPKRARLHETKMVGIGGLSPAHKTRLLGDEAKMLPIAVATRLVKGKGAFVDMFGFECCGRS